MNNNVGGDLKLALEVNEEERIISTDLNVGYIDGDRWEIIIKYNGDINTLAYKYDFVYTILLGGYAVIKISKANIESLSFEREVLYIDKPTQMYFEDMYITSASDILKQKLSFNNINTNLGCVNGRYSKEYQGTGVYIAIIDSGIDIYNEFFMFDNGDSKIEYLWDQSIDGNPPTGYYKGYEFSNEEINEYIHYGHIINSLDSSGHGTAVAAICAMYAKNAKLIIVKLDNRNGGVNTASLMMAIDYCIRKSIDDAVPVVINLSFGNNYGSHAGDSVVENYIDIVTEKSKCTFCVGSGNEGISGRHSKIYIESYSENKMEFIVNKGLMSVNIQLWSLVNYIDVYIELPDGVILGPINQRQNTSKYYIGNISYYIVCSGPSSISSYNEIYISIIAKSGTINQGIYKLRYINNDSNYVEIDGWLPVADSTASEVYFFNADENISLTVPGSADNVITVGAYNQKDNTYLSFSGRGYSLDGRVKPEIVAPGSEVVSAGNGYFMKFTGTSFATPIVSAGASKLMEWGIINNNDPFMYGRKLKKVMMDNTNRIEGILEYPDERVGYGALCLENVFRSFRKG